jgi:hypothetical protein
MTTVNFAPATSFNRLATQNRQLCFTQKPNGVVEVRVSFDSKAINTIYEDSIFIQTTELQQPLEQPRVQKLETMTQEQKRDILRGIENGTVAVDPVDGATSGVKKPDTVKVFFRQIRSLTLKIPS